MFYFLMFRRKDIVMLGGEMTVRESTEVQNLQRDVTETQRRSPDETKTSTGTVQEREEMKMEKADILSEVKRAQGIGELIKKGIEERKGTKTQKGGKKGRGW